MRILESRHSEEGLALAEIAVQGKFFGDPKLVLSFRLFRSRKPAIRVEMDAEEVCELLRELGKFTINELCKDADAT